MVRHTALWLQLSFILQAGKGGLSATLTRQKPKINTAIQEAIDAVKLKAAGGKPVQQSAQDELQAVEAANPAEAPLKGFSATAPRPRAVSRIGPSPLSHQKST